MREEERRELEDKAAAAFVALVALFRKYDRSMKASAMDLGRMAGRAVRDAARRLRWKESPTDLEEYEDLAAPEDLAAIFDEPLEIELLMGKIPDELDRKIVLRLAESATQREIALELGLSQQAVSARLANIRRTLCPLVHEGETG